MKKKVFILKKLYQIEIVFHVIVKNIFYFINNYNCDFFKNYSNYHF